MWVMRMKGLFQVSVLLILANAAYAADLLKPIAPASPKAETKQKHRPFNGTIKAVSKPLRAIVLRGEKAQTFFVLPETKIKRDGQPIAFEQIVPGEPLGGYARQNADGRWEALTLNLGVKKKEEPAAAPIQTNGPPVKTRR